MFSATTISVTNGSLKAGSGCARALRADGSIIFSGGGSLLSSLSIDAMLSSPSYEHWELGIERYLQRHAAAKSKPVSGLESPKEHNAFFVDLSDRESEALLLILFINAAREGPSATMIHAWRRGDVEALNRILRESFQDFPSLARRLIDMRNQNWLPKIDGYLRSGQTYFVVVGAGHLGGPNGLLGLLKARGCKLEQL